MSTDKQHEAAQDQDAEAAEEAAVGMHPLIRNLTQPENALAARAEQQRLGQLPQPQPVYAAPEVVPYQTQPISADGTRPENEAAAHPQVTHETHTHVVDMTVTQRGAAADTDDAEDTDEAETPAAKSKKEPRA